MSKGSKTQKQTPKQEPRPKRAKAGVAAPRALWLMTAEPGSGLEASVFGLWRAARDRGWDLTVALPLRRSGAFGAPGEVLERWPIDLELGPGEFHGEARRAGDGLVWLVPQSADLSPAFTSAFLCAAALDLGRRDGQRVVHGFGLRASLAPVLLSTRLGADPRFDELRTLLAVDQVEDLGAVDATVLHDLGLPAGLLEDPVGGVDGRFSALKAGVVFADRIVVPSPRLRRALAASAAGRAASERGRDLATIAWSGDSGTSPASAKKTAASKRAVPEKPAADPIAAALDRLATLYRGLLRKAPRRVEVVVPPRAAVEAPDAAPPAPPAEPFIDWGPALPERYGEDTCELLVQSPRGLYAYWEVSPETQRQAGGELFLRLRSRAGERVLGPAPGPIGEWWIEAEPGETYVLDIAAADGRALLRSASARTPHSSPSAETDVRMVHRDRLRGARPAAPAIDRRDRSERAAPRLPPLPARAIAPEPDPSRFAPISPRAPEAERGGEWLVGEREFAPTAESQPAGSPGVRVDRADDPEESAWDVDAEAPSSLGSGSGTGKASRPRPAGSSEQRPRRSS